MALFFALGSTCFLVGQSAGTLFFNVTTSGGTVA
jgi:hypothetical protein